MKLSGVFSLEWNQWTRQAADATTNSWHLRTGVGASKLVIVVLDFTAWRSEPGWRAPRYPTSRTCSRFHREAGWRCPVMTWEPWAKVEPRQLARYVTPDA